MYKIIDIEQGSSEWHAYRNRHIGASDAASILGLNPWKSAIATWKEKVGLKKDEQNDMMRRGIEHEKTALALCLHYLNVNVECKNYVLESIEHPWMCASLDGFNIEQGILVEVKCPGDKWHSYALEGKIPEHYYPQLQHQLAVTGLNDMWFFSYHVETQCGIHINVKRDEKFILDMIEKEKAFYECMLSMKMPKKKSLDKVARDFHIQENN